MTASSAVANVRMRRKRRASPGSGALVRPAGRSSKHAGNLLLDCRSSAIRIGGVANGPADDDVIGAGTERERRRDDAALIVGNRSLRCSTAGIPARVVALRRRPAECRASRSAALCPTPRAAARPRGRKRSRRRSRPRRLAARASARAPRAVSPMPMSARSDGATLVSTVTARTLRCSPLACAAASATARSPWTVRNDAPERASCRTAAVTVAGMS